MNLRPASPFATFAALFVLLTACGPTTPEAVPPASDSPAPTPTGSTAAPPGGLVMSQDVCKVDADCVPAACCHAAACMSVDKAKPCNMMCTQVCEPGTLDCGGSCLCHEGHCAAKLGNGGK
ncbi:MAG: hypothetical protein ABJE95_18645 [Byssovorax sp.]